jgi:hypothetical protein
METITTDAYPKGTPRRHLQDTLTCPLTGAESMGLACLELCENAVERGCCHFHCTLLDEEAGAHALPTQAR